ncbi:MAG: ATP-binding cassette domain-containing protein [Candidatus Neomarinimicrobiota bacterium]
MNTVEIDHIIKTFGNVVAVDRLSLSVPGGSIYGFIGPNGSGKTTTLRMIMNIFYPDSGAIRVFGQPVGGAASDRIGYLPEERGLYRTMKVRDVLRFYGDLKNGRNVAAEVDTWLKRLNLADWSDKKVQTLSKGMSQKVQFIATVVSRPELVILDEPFSGLDPVNMEILKDAILELQAQGTTVIFSTHDMSVAEKMCNFIFMIFKGQKVLDGTLDSIQRKYGSDTIRIRTEDGRTALNDLPGVEKINDFGRLQELRLAPGSDTQIILTEVMKQTRVDSFETVQPSLHDIFIRIAGPEAEEVNHA